MKQNTSPAGGRAISSDLDQSVALIAGPCDDTGIGIARCLSARGAAVALCGPDRGALDTIAGEIVAQGEKAIAVVTEGPQALPATIDRVRQSLGKIDILVNNPGELIGRSLPDLSTGEFEKGLAAVLTASFAFIREVVPVMRERHYGRIVNIYGLSFLGFPAHANLGAAYAGIFGLARSVALETAASGITVNSVVKGDISRASLPAPDAEKLAGQIPVKRMGTAADVAHAVKFFASPETKYVTGQTLFVCGGKSAYFSMSV